METSPIIRGRRNHAESAHGLSDLIARLAREPRAQRRVIGAHRRVSNHRDLLGKVPNPTRHRIHPTIRLSHHREGQQGRPSFRPLSDVRFKNQRAVATATALRSGPQSGGLLAAALLEHSENHSTTFNFGEAVSGVTTNVLAATTFLLRSDHRAGWNVAVTSDS